MTKYLRAAAHVVAALPYCATVLVEAVHQGLQDPVELEIRQITVSDLYEEISSRRAA